jgi:hypothetical protein
MDPNRTTPLTPFFSSLAILSFKKKSKGSDLGGLSTSMDDLNLDGENLSLSDLGGSVGSLSKLEKKDKKSGGLDDDFLGGITTSGPRADDRKFQEIEASVNDLKKHAESADMSSKATKGEIEFMKKDLSQINDSIKSLLNVYEAVSRQYNPFVDSEMPSPKKPAMAEEDEPSMMDGNLSLGSLGDLNDDKKVDLSSSPMDDNGPLDRIVKPDDDEEEDIRNVGRPDRVEISPDLLGKMISPDPEPVPEPEQEFLSVARSTREASTTDVDTYALEQIHKLVEHQLSKVYRARLKGEEVDAEDVEALDRWMREFKRLGGG